MHNMTCPLCKGRRLEKRSIFLTSVGYTNQLCVSNGIMPYKQAAGYTESRLGIDKAYVCLDCGSLTPFVDPVKLKIDFSA